MKFLLFNAAVIVALVYLFNADRGDFHAAADRLYDTAEGVGEVTRRAVRKVEDGMPKVLAGAREDAAGARVPLQAAPTAKPVANSSSGAEPIPEEKAPPASATATAETAAPPRPKPVRSIVQSAPAAAPAARTESAGRRPEKTSTAVEQRRKEVLDGLAADEGAAAVALAEGERLMSPEQRVRELYALAEEMEMLFVTKMAR